MIDEYNYNDVESGRSETLISALDKIEVLESKLKLAKECLEIYSNEENWCESGEHTFNDLWLLSEDGYYDAQRVLDEINE